MKRRPADEHAEQRSDEWSPFEGLPRRYSRRVRWIRGLFLGLIIGILVAGLQARGSFTGADDQSLSFRLRQRNSVAQFQPPIANIVLVGMDDYTCRSDGDGCPVPRAHTAQLIDRLRASGARFILLDQLFTKTKAGTDLLAAAIKRAGNVVLAESINGQDTAVFDVTTATPPLEPLRAAARAVALDTPRCGPPVTRIDTYAVGCVTGNGWVPTLPLALYRLVSGHAGAYKGAGPVRLNYAGPPFDTFDTISYRILREAPLCLAHGYHVHCKGVNTDLWDGLKGSIVLVGLTCSLHYCGGTSPDLFANPFGETQPIAGVEVVATAFNTLFNHDPLWDPDQSTQFALCLLTALAGAALATGAGLAAGLVLACLLSIVYYLAVFFLLVAGNMVLPVVGPEIATSASFLLVLGARYSIKDRDERRTKQLLARFVSPAVAEDLAAEGLEFAVGKRRAICVLFSDLRSFTTFAERLEPEVVMGALRTYFNCIVPLVHAQGGTVDKFIGDGMMALFGAPAPLGAPCLAALRAAVQMQMAMDELNGRLDEALGEPLRMGIGIHFGEAVFGLSGAMSKLEFTAVGDTVNVASRLESLCRDHGCAIVLSAAVVAQLPAALSAHLIDLGTVRIRGRKADMAVFGIRTIDEMLLGALNEQA